MKYFIEDVETNEWFRFDPELMPTVHTYGKGWDKPDPVNKDYWTIDPNEALSFEKQEDAETFLNEIINSYSLCKSDVGFEKRKLTITEHLFI